MAATYKRTVSSDDGRGFKYENKMTAFVALRLYSNADEFHLANNLNSGEKFDDMVFTYKTNDRWNTYFVQLKHKQTSTLLKKKLGIAALRNSGDFVLSKYFDSFKKIYRKLTNNSSDVIFQRGPIGARYVLFTNAFLQDLITTRGLRPIDCSILSTKQPNELNILFDVERDVDLWGEMATDPMLREFVSKFYFCSGQASEDEMDEMIENEVKKIMLMTTAESQHWSDGDLKNISLKFCVALYAWYTKGKYLTKDDVKNILFDISVASQCGKKNATALKFTPSFCQLITGVLKQDNVVCLESQAENSNMCIALLRQLGLTDEPNKLMELKQLQTGQFQEHLLAINNPQITLVIDCDSDTLGIKKEELITFFRQLFLAKPGLRIVFVTVAGNQAALAFVADLKIKKKKFNCTLIQLTEESKRNIMGSEVIFQGYKTPLNLLLASPNSRVFDDVINMEAMTQLLQGRKVEVGICPIEQIPYYVPRVLTRFAMIAPTVFDDPRINACFAISGISLEDAVMKLPQGSTQTGTANEIAHKKYIILEGDEETMFAELAKRCPKPLHWLALTKKSWCWKRSTRNLNDLATHVERLNRFCEYLPTDDIMQIKDQIVVVIAEPGMGKSTLITHLAVETKRRNPEMWIISLALNDFTAQFDDPTFLGNIKQSTRDLIADAAGVRGKEASKLNMRLFNQCYDVSGNMIILLDGFDEITPYYTEHGLAIIKVLQETAVSRVWITARPVLFELLENATCCFSYSIKPFEEKDQINFFKKFWGHQFPMIEAEKLGMYIKRVLDTIKNSFDEKMNQFTGVPLQTRMLAEVFQSGLKAYHETGELVLKDRINGVELFEEFVRIKRGIQMDKAKITATNAIARFEQKRLNDLREQELMRLALLTLLPRKTCASLNPAITETVVEQVKEMVRDGNEKSGIVMSFSGETPQFIHRTFAEYFVALFFTKNYRSNQAFMLSDTFSSKNFEFVKYFFDRILCAGLKLHDAVLERQYEEMEQIILENKDTVAKTDLGGRTALHVAATMADNERAVRLLMQAGANADAIDKILGLPALEHAIKNRHVANIAALFEKSAVSSLPPKVIPVDRDSLRIAVRGDYLRLLMYLLNNGIYAVESLDELSPQNWLDNEEEVQTQMTILHLAAAYNAVEILKYLLRRDSRDTKWRLLEAVDSQGRTPLMLAAEREHIEAISCLMEAGSSFQGGSGKGLLEFAVEKRNLNLLSTAMNTASNESPEEFGPAVTMLIADKSEWSAMVLQIFLSFCPSLVNYITAKGLPLISFAALKNNQLAVRKLCEMGADVSSAFPLHIAVSKGFDDVVEELLKYERIDVNACNDQGLTPVYLATRSGSPELVEKLVDAGADIHKLMSDGSSLEHAVGVSCNEALFIYLLENEFDFKTKNNAGETGLSLLIKNGAFSLVHLLDPTYETAEVKEVIQPIVENVTQPVVKQKQKQKPVAQVAPQQPVGNAVPVAQAAPQQPVGNAVPVQPAANAPKKKKNKKKAAQPVAPQPPLTMNNAEDFLTFAKNLCGGSLSDLAETLYKTKIESSAANKQPQKKKKNKVVVQPLPKKKNKPVLNPAPNLGPVHQPVMEGSTPNVRYVPLPVQQVPKKKNKPINNPAPNFGPVRPVIYNEFVPPPNVSDGQGMQYPQPFGGNVFRPPSSLFGFNAPIPPPGPLMGLPDRPMAPVLQQPRKKAPHPNNGPQPLMGNPQAVQNQGKKQKQKNGQQQPQGPGKAKKTPNQPQ